MAWDFETDPEFQQKLDWMEDFVREKVEPLGLLGTPTTLRTLAETNWFAPYRKR